MSANRWDVSRRQLLAGSAAAAVAAGAWSPPAAADPELEPDAAFGHGLGMTDRQWAGFLRQQDLIWKKLPTLWHEGPFLGDGRLGSLVYAEPNANAVRFTVQHAEVQDYRRFGTHFGTCRLPVGHVTLEPAGTITGVDWRLDLWNAELAGTITTDKGTLTLRAYLHTERSVLVASVNATGQERGRWTFHPARAISPRADFDPLPAGYEANPDPTLKTVDGIQLVVQPLLAGGQTVTGYRVQDHRSESTLHLSVAHSHPDSTAEAKALDTVRKAVRSSPWRLAGEHQDWWHSFYRKSFLSIPEAKIQSFYWIQLYKAAAGTRAGGPVMATCGPWLERTPWPAVWWNLNLQLEYWLIHGSNHLELDAVSTTLRAAADQLALNVRPEYQHDSAGVSRSTDRRTVANGMGSVSVPGGTSGTLEVGNLTWALHNVWLSYRHSMDTGLLREVIFPLLRRSINYYLHFLATGPDGKLHLPTTHSPEYGNAPDCNYDLALIRWGASTLIEASALLKINDPLASTWRQLLRDLVPYPVDENGFMVGAGVPFAKSHRHYSHLLMVFPLYEITWEQPEHRALIEKSFRHWIGLEGAHRGYSYTGSASLLAGMGKGNEARRYLLEFFDPAKPYPVRANTMYTEAGPVVETPLSGAQSVHDLLCQSWGGVIRIFPAVPDAWADVTLHDFRTQGAFLVSAVRKGGSTRWVRVRSLAGEPCLVRHGLAGALSVRSAHGRPVHWHDRGDGVIELELERGDEVFLYPRGTRPDLTVAPVTVTIPAPPWGLPG